MKRILGGYASFFREILGLPNDGAFVAPPTNLAVLIAICGAIGLARNVLSKWLDVLPGFYEYKPDILWTMFNFPIHLWLFAGALLHWQLRLLGARDLRVDSIMGLAFHLQILHLIIPFLDSLGHRLGLPWVYVVGSHAIATEWYTNLIYWTPGIIAGWWTTAYISARVLRGRLGIGWFPIIFTSLSTFVILAIPKDVVFPTLNTVFSRSFGPLLWDPLQYMFVRPKWFPFWGYGTFFALTWMLGLAYYLRRRASERA